MNEPLQQKCQQAPPLGTGKKVQNRKQHVVQNPVKQMLKKEVLEI